MTSEEPLPAEVVRAREVRERAGLAPSITSTAVTVPLLRAIRAAVERRKGLQREVEGPRAA